MLMLALVIVAAIVCNATVLAKAIDVGLTTIDVVACVTVDAIFVISIIITLSGGCA